MGMPGWPLLARSTASMARTRIASAINREGAPVAGSAALAAFDMVLQWVGPDALAAVAVATWPPVRAR
jgi:hypothetical protein